MERSVAERDAEDSNVRSKLCTKISEIESTISELEQFLKSEEVIQINEKTSQALTQVSHPGQGTQSVNSGQNIDRHSEMSKRRWVDDNGQGNDDLKASNRGRARYQENYNIANTQSKPRLRQIEYYSGKDRFHNESRDDNRDDDRRGNRNFDRDRGSRNLDGNANSVQNRQNSRHAWTGSSSKAGNIDEEFELYTKSANSSIAKQNGHGNDVGASELESRKHVGKDSLNAEESAKESGINRDVEEVENDVLGEHHDEGSDLLAALDGKL